MSGEASDSKSGLEAKYSCVVCHKRKVRCDRAKPCANCVKNQVECEYRAPPAPKRRAKNTDRLLLAKIQKYEEQLKKAGASVDESGNLVPSPSIKTNIDPICSPAASRSGTSASLEVPSRASAPPHSRSPSKTDDGVLLQDSGKSRYVENNLWVSIKEELPTSQNFVQGGNQDQSCESDSNESIPEPRADELLFSSSSAPCPVDHYPRPEHVMILWRAFLDNVHPITKMIHAPTVQKLVELSCQHCRSIGRNNIALLFSIHLMALLSMTEEECKWRLGTSRKALLKKYHRLTQHALLRVHFLSTSDFTVLTAFVFYLVSTSNDR